MRSRTRKIGFVVGMPLIAHVLAGLLLSTLIPRAPRGMRELAVGLASLAGAALPFEVNGEPALVSLAVESEVLPAALLPVRPARMPTRDGDATVESAPRVADGDEPHPPARDRSAESPSVPRGLAPGRDPMRLRRYESDGARVDRPVRTQVAKHFTSPEPERRLPEPGAEEHLASPRVDRVASTRSAAAAEPPVGGTSQRPRAGQAGQAASLHRPPPPSRLPSSFDHALRAETGPVRFEAPTLGPAQDEVSVRGGSTADRSAPIEAGRSGAAGLAQPGGIGQGEYGAVVDMRQGHAIADYGAPLRLTPGPKVAFSATNDGRAGLLREIRRRAGQALRFPRRLALRLEQGDTIVRFSVGRDGEVSGPVELVKSAGFPEFDEEARAAVLRAAPYPKMPEALTVTIRFVFENPVVR